MFMLLIGAFLLVTMPPIGIVYLCWLFFIKEPRDDKTRRWRNHLQDTNLANILNSHPGPCPQCGAEDWSRGILRLVPSGAFRLMGLWPTDGTVSVADFHCGNCKSHARYGMCHQAADRGWIMLDRYSGGW